MTKGTKMFVTGVTIGVIATYLYQNTASPVVAKT